MVRLVIVAAVRLYREGIAEALSRRPGFEVLASIANPLTVPSVVLELLPDMVLLDMGMPDSHALVRQVLEVASQARVVALGISEVEGDVLACAEAGVAGYVPREGTFEDLFSVIESVGREELLCSPRIAATMLRRISLTSAAQRQATNNGALTSRERQILHLIDDGASNKDIARRLGIEVATVKNHVHNLLEKLHVHRRAEAAARVRGRETWRSFA